ncbi:acyltransferase [Henriciella algicola]|uniref:Acyltransferase n=2 Tax=Henriciella algicola TaxID=1608422 RepID=A0A399RCN7_9PROT|nr:acyltransferase [Henriciella algicola]
MLVMSEGAYIGTLSVIRNVDKVELGKGAIIGTFNWIYGFPSGITEHFQEAGRASELIMGEGASLTSRHIVDCTSRVTIGAFTTVAGFYSQILTHGIDIRTNRQTSRPVTIGKYCLIGSRSTIVKGAVLPEGTVLSAGSMFRGTPEESHHIYSGVPATPVRALSIDDPYFTRLNGPVS